MKATVVEKQLICLKRKEPEHVKEKRSEFGKHFLLFNEKERWLNIDIAGVDEVENTGQLLFYHFIERAFPVS